MFCKVAEKLNCTTEDTAQMMDCLRQVPWQELRRTNFFCKVSSFSHVIIYAHANT